jgi:hypothetical protein
MTILQVIVPSTLKQLHLLPDCLASIKKNTPVDHIVNLAVGQQMVEDRVGEIVASARSVYDRSGLVITCCDPSLGYNGVVLEVIRGSDFPYVAVLPATHRIVDNEWFGKMQLPLIRVPSCAMTFAHDDLEPGTLPSFPMDWRKPVPSQFMLLPRNALGTVKNAPVDSDGSDVSTCVRDHLRTVGAVCWAVPSCRIVKLHGEW